MEYTKDSIKICKYPEIDRAIMVSKKQLSRKLIKTNSIHCFLLVKELKNLMMLMIE